MTLWEQQDDEHIIAIAVRLIFERIAHRVASGKPPLPRHPDSSAMVAARRRRKRLAIAG